MRMVADAVAFERVSATEFPVNREINRENREIRPEAATRSAIYVASAAVFSDIPCNK